MMVGPDILGYCIRVATTSRLTDWPLPLTSERQVRFVKRHRG